MEVSLGFRLGGPYIDPRLPPRHCKTAGFGGGAPLIVPRREPEVKVPGREPEVYCYNAWGGAKVMVEAPARKGACIRNNRPLSLFEMYRSSLSFILSRFILSRFSAQAEYTVHIQSKLEDIARDVPTFTIEYQQIVGTWRATSASNKDIVHRKYGLIRFFFYSFKTQNIHLSLKRI